MRRFWDRRAREDAFYFVDSRLTYRRPDTAAFWASGEEDLDRLLDAAGVALDPSDRIVEIGCGMGRLTRVIAARAGDVRALDVSERMLEIAKAHHPDLGNVSWTLGGGSSLTGIDDASADVCLSHVVFQHIPDSAVTLAYVRETGRVLRPGGWAAFQVSNDPSVHRPSKPSRRLRRLISARLRRSPHGQDDPAWLGSAVDLAQLEAVAGEAGMDLERVRGAGTQYCLVLLRRRAG